MYPLERGIAGVEGAGKVVMGGGDSGCSSLEDELEELLESEDLYLRSLETSSLDSL